MDKMFEGMCVVEFIVLLVERIASRFWGAIVSHEITTDSGGENITISSGFLPPEEAECRAAMLV